jgi:hypothetical protein
MTHQNSFGAVKFLITCPLCSQMLLSSHAYCLLWRDCQYTWLLQTWFLGCSWLSWMCNAFLCFNYAYLYVGFKQSTAKSVTWKSQLFMCTWIQIKAKMVQISDTISSKIMFSLLFDTVLLKLETVGQQAYLFSAREKNMATNIVSVR